MFCSLNDVRQVEIDYVVACDDVGVNLLQEIAPSPQKLFLSIETQNLAADNRRALLQRENISDKHIVLTLNLDNICDLDNRIGVWRGEPAGLSRALYVETENAQRSDLRVFALARQTLDTVVVDHVKLDLAGGLPLAVVPHFPFTFLNPDPCHTANFIVNHEPQCVRHVRLIADLAEAVPLAEGQALLSGSA